MAWHQTGNKPLPKPVMTWLIYVYVRHLDSGELTNWDETDDSVKWNDSSTNQYVI